MSSMVPKLMAVALLMTFTVFAGCAEDGRPAAISGEPSYEEFDLAATATTGVIRGVVVDQSIVPIEGVTVLLGADGKEALTNAEGAFGFKDVEPGLHTLIVDKTGYVSLKVAASVEAGVDVPDMVRVLLESDPSELPIVDVRTFNGYVECSFSTAAYRVAACGVNNVGGTLKDDFIMTHGDLDANALWIQAEMLWQSTQPAGDHMMFTTEADCVSDGCDVGDTAQGESPLLVIADTERLNQEDQLYAGALLHRVFNMEYEGTAPPIPICDVPNPIHGGTMCVKGWGATLQQKFSIFTHTFSNSVPQSGWQFSLDGEPQLIPA
jgi:hypothetical protein